jgi:hypothetical protein
VLTGATGVLEVTVEVQSPQVGSELVEVLTGATGVLEVELQSPQVGSELVEVLTGATGVLEVVVQSPQVSVLSASAVLVGLYGQFVTVGPHEVMVTSSVTVTE